MKQEEKFKEAKRLYETANADQRYVLESLFPELRKSENERIRKWLIHYFTEVCDNVSEKEKKSVLDWLERQVEQKPFGFNNSDTIDHNLNDYCCKIYSALHKENGGVLSFARLQHMAMDIYGWCKEQGEQMPVGKVEPKFHEGEWVVSPNGVYWHIDKISNNRYEVTSNTGESSDWPLDTNIYHRFSIQDAKDGDVLATLDYILIFKKFLKNDGGISYCHYDFGAGNPQFIWLEDKNWYFGKEAIVHPATKEQRDLLFQKMREAGYEWDAEKKELKKIVVPIFNIGDTIAKKHNSNIHNFGFFTITDIIGGKYWYNDRIICDITEQDEWEIYEQKPAWSEEDKRMFESVLWHLRNSVNNGDTEHSAGQLEIWFKSLKERVQPHPKQEWSEEDEKILDEVITNYESGYLPSVEKRDEIIEKLESFKERHTWKPSDEQMTQLKRYCPDNRPLTSLYEQLKKLREEDV